MNNIRLIHIFNVVRNFLFSSVNREFLIFLFFFALSGTFWVLMALNETYEKEIEVPVSIVDIPKNVVLTSDTTSIIKVSVKDKGYSILAYLYGKKIQGIKIKFKTYEKSKGFGIVSSGELQKLVYQQLFNSSRITTIKPDKLEFFYNYGARKRIPVMLFGKIIPGQSYYLSKIKFEPDSIEIYASNEILDSIKAAKTKRLYIKNLTDTAIRTVELQKIKGVKYVPDRIKISMYPDILTEEKIEVPITAINMPEGKILRTFPPKVNVTFTVGASLFRMIHQENFKVIVDYNEILANPSEKCNVYLRFSPHEVRNARIDVSQVDYLIEEQ